MEKRVIFKTCPLCLTEWVTRDEFLDDKSLEINGYGADFERLEWSLFYFTHNKEGCGLALPRKTGHSVKLIADNKFNGVNNETETKVRQTI